MQSHGVSQGESAVIRTDILEPFILKNMEEKNEAFY